VRPHDASFSISSYTDAQARVASKFADVIAINLAARSSDLFCV
jgi:hypothetical protein